MRRQARNALIEGALKNWMPDGDKGRSEYPESTRKRAGSLVHDQLQVLSDAGYAVRKLTADQSFHEGMCEEAVGIIRSILLRECPEVPCASFADDHVANLILCYKQRGERIAELEAALNALNAQPAAPPPEQSGR